MSKREIAALACRILAIYVFIGAVEALDDVFRLAGQIAMSLNAAGAVGQPAATAGRFTAAQVSMLLLACAPCALRLVVALCLWGGAQTIAGWMVKEAAGDPPVDLRGHDLRALAFSFIGLLLLAQSVPNILWWGVSVIWDQLRWSQGPIAYAYVDIAMYLRALLGLWLLFGSRGLVGMVRALQNMGKTPRETGSPSA